MWALGHWVPVCTRLVSQYCVACVASVSVWFLSKERPRNGRARNEIRANRPLPRSFTCAIFRAFLVPRSFLLNRTETLATQAKYCAYHTHDSLLLSVFNVASVRAKWRGYVHSYISGFQNVDTTLFCAS